MTPTSMRRDFVTSPILNAVAHAVPAISATEADAIKAGDTWLDALLFTGNPNWRQLLDTPATVLSHEEQMFLDGPVEELCGLIDEWKVTFETHDLPTEAWDFLKREKFFGMIIPKTYGGLGFSAYGHSEVVRKLSTRSSALAVTAMVPNSLGPGELILEFGTDAQRQYWLPRLADGREIPCFGLTSPEAGSDAASMTDIGIVTHGEWNGETVLGIRLNWHKRYITLGPVATVLGLAFKLSDPDGLLGGQKDLGITLALVPTTLPGVEIGRRHLPAMQAFQNGPNQGRDVFIPISEIIGGREKAGQGWTMLMSALAAGRGLSLPSQSAAAAAFAAYTTGAYARVRSQFHVPIAEFEGVQERLARIAGNAYLLDAARRLTCAGLDQGHRPAVISSIMKLHSTERMRVVINDAMDVHGGKAIIDGPSNYLGNTYRSLPVAITVEGANILTRSLMVFGQGAIRSHPFLLSEIEAISEPDRSVALVAFDKVLWKQVAHTLKTAIRSFVRSWSGSAFCPAPDAGRARRFYRQVSRYAAAFALMSDIAFLSLGGELKRRELLSGRLGDILSELYLLCAALKRWEDEGRQDGDFVLLRYVMDSGFQTIEQRFDEIIANMPNRATRWMLRLFILPFGRRQHGPSDYVIRKSAAILTTPSPARERLTANVYRGRGEDAVALLEDAFAQVTAAQPVLDRLRKAGIKTWRDAGERLTRSEALQLEALDVATERVLAVDDFDPKGFGATRSEIAQDVSRPKLSPSVDA